MPTKPADDQVSSEQLTHLVNGYESALAQGRQKYMTADELGQKIVAVVGPHKTARLSDGRQITIRDPYIDKKTGQPKAKVWKPAGFNRWDLDVEAAPPIDQEQQPDKGGDAPQGT